MPKKLQASIKEEARILAVKHLRECEVLGVVFRGKYWLDGVFRLYLTKWDTLCLARGIRKIKYYPELKIVILDHDVTCINPGTLGKLLNLPIIKVNEKGEAIQASGITLKEASLLLRNLSFQEVAEPVRVLRLLVLNLRLIGTRIT